MRANANPMQADKTRALLAISVVDPRFLNVSTGGALPLPTLPHNFLRRIRFKYGTRGTPLSADTNF